MLFPCFILAFSERKSLACISPSYLELGPPGNFLLEIFLYVFLKNEEQAVILFSYTIVLIWYDNCNICEQWVLERSFLILWNKSMILVDIGCIQCL